MARARNLKPSFFMNDSLAECHPLSRLLFAGLWTLADREGRLEDRPKKIKAEVLAYDDCDCDTLLNDLNKHGFIQRYESGCNRYIQVSNFVKHQNPHVKEAESIIPAPDSPGAGLVQNVPLPLSPLPLPESLKPITHNKTPRTKVNDYTEEFEEFWKIYPHNLASKKESSAAYHATIKKGIKHETLIAGASSYAEYIRISGGEIKFTKHATTWLNKHSWETSYPADAAGNQSKPIGKSGWTTAAEQIIAEDRARREAERSGH